MFFMPNIPTAAMSGMLLTAMFVAKQKDAFRALTIAIIVLFAL